MHARLLTKTLDNAQIQPFRHPLVAPPPHGFKGGLVPNDGPDWDRLRHTRYGQPVDCFPDAGPFECQVAGEFVYAGPVYDHFGHFMSEMCHRFLPSLQSFDCRKFLFCGILDHPLMQNFDMFPRFLQELLIFFSIAAGDVTVLRKNSTVERLHVCEAGSDFGGGPKPGYLKDLREFTTTRLHDLQPCRTPMQNVYVSRSALSIGGCFLGERYLESILAEEGFSIFHPEKWSLTEQMAVYAQADILVFAEGSACHGTELLGEGMLNHCILLARRKDHVGIFERVLKPRSTKFATFDASFNLGSIAGNAGEQPAAHIGVSLLDVNALRRFFRQHGISPLIDLRLDTYLEAAESDLARYIYAHLKQNSITSLEHMKHVHENFVAARTAVCEP